MAVDSTNFFKAVGTYNLTLNVVEEPATKVSVKIIVVDNSVVVNGDEYAIGANNIKMSLSEAKKIKNQNEFIVLSKAEAWKKDDYSIKGSVVVDSTNFGASATKVESQAFKAKVGTYSITFKVLEEPDTQIETKIVVVADSEKPNPKLPIVGSNEVLIAVATLLGSITLLSVRGLRRE